MDRVILHSDMNSFFASVECMLDKSLRGKPVAVGGSVESRHGIILAKSEEAKKFGVRTAETIWQAKKKCPELIVVPPQFEEYIKCSEYARDIYRRYTDMIEPFGLDECWLDVTGSTRLFGSGGDIAQRIRREIKDELGLTVSVGVSFNKVFAKLGSDMKKPDAVTSVLREEFKDKIWGLAATEMIGVGGATAKKLSGFGIHTIGQIAECEERWLTRVLGKQGGELWKYANGLDSSPVARDGIEVPLKSIGHGITCKEDLLNNDEVWLVILALTQDVSRRLKKHNASAKGVQIGIRDNSLITKQFQTTLSLPTQSALELSTAAMALFRKNYEWCREVRAVTVTAINLAQRGENLQLDLFSSYEQHERQEKLDDAVISLRKRFGDDAVKNASLMQERKMPPRGHGAHRIGGFKYGDEE